MYKYVYSRPTYLCTVDQTFNNVWLKTTSPLPTERKHTAARVQHCKEETTTANSYCEFYNTLHYITITITVTSTIAITITITIAITLHYIDTYIHTYANILSPKFRVGPEMGYTLYPKKNAFKFRKPGWTIWTKPFGQQVRPLFTNSKNTYDNNNKNNNRWSYQQPQRQRQRQQPQQPQHP